MVVLLVKLVEELSEPEPPQALSKSVAAHRLKVLLIFNIVVFPED